MTALDERGVTVTEQLQATAGINSRDDAFHAGYIAAIKDFLQINLEEIKES
jgi:hypothetical protein